QRVLWAPERMDRPMTSTSSWTAAEAIISGVWRRPVEMTSMPAARRARAMTLAPRSWPSRPGLAISTRILFSGILFCVLLQAKVKSGDGDFFVGAESVAHGVADFAERGVGFYGG